MVRPDAWSSSTFLYFRCETGLIRIDPGDGPMPAIGERVTGRLGLAIDGDLSSFTISGLEVRLDRRVSENRGRDDWPAPDWLTKPVALSLAAGALAVGIPLLGARRARSACSDGPGGNRPRCGRSRRNSPPM